MNEIIMEMSIFSKIKTFILPRDIDIKKVEEVDRRMDKVLKAVVDGDEEWFCTSRQKKKETEHDCYL